MTLHEAIQKVLEQNGQPMTAIEIADIINSDKLFKRGDGNPVPSSQIQAKVNEDDLTYYIIDDKIHVNKIYIDEFSGKDWISNFGEYPIEFYLDLFIEHNREFRKYRLNNIERILFTVELMIVLSTFEKSANRIIKSDDIILKASQLNKSGELRNCLNFLLKNHSIIEELSEQSVVEFQSRILSLKHEVFFRALLNFINISDSKSENYQAIYPHYLYALIVELIRPQDGELIFDPAAGSCNSLLAAFNNNNHVKLVGQEINPILSELGKIKLIFSSCKDFVFENSNSIFDPLVNINEADIAISIPPFGGKIDNEMVINFERFCKDRSYEVVLFEFMLSRLKSDKGRMGIIVPDSFLWKKSNKLLRQELIDRDKLEAIISLPLNGIHPYNGAKTNLLIVRDTKNPKRKNTVIFIKVDKKSKNEKPVDNSVISNEILSIYHDLKPQKTIVDHKIISNNLIIDQEYDFTVHKYLSEGLELLDKLNELESLIPLNSLLSRSKNARVESYADELKLVQIKDLNDSESEFYLNQNKLQYTDEINPNYKVLNKSSLLIARIGEKLKPTYFEYKGEDIAVINNIFTFDVKTEIVNVEYLISQLNSDLIKIQLQMNRQLLGVIPSINQETFLKLVIPLPSLLEQMERLAFYKKQHAEKSELTQFINEIRLVTTPNEIKVEIERFAKKIFSTSEYISYRTEFDFDVEKFPFSDKDIEATRFIKRPQGSKNRWFTYLLLIGENNQINGVLTVESSDDITFKQYYEINAYANFIIQASSKYIQQNTNKLLNEFNHTTKNILKDIDKILNDFLETKNEKLVKSLKECYLKEEELINHLIKNSDRKKKDFIAFNRLEDAHNIVNRHFEFFKRRHQYYTTSVNSDFEIIKLKDFVTENMENRNNVIVNSSHLGNESIYIKCAPIELAFNDLIENALCYSSDGKLRIDIIPKDHYIEFQFLNNVQNMMSKANYMNLGNEDIKKPDGTYSTGLSNAFRALKEDNEISLAAFEYYEKNKVFKLSIKLKKP